MRRTSAIAALLALASACSSSSANDPPPVAGNGIKVDPATQAISIDDSKVPLLPACAAGQMVRRNGSGWECVAAAPDSAQLGGKPAAAYLTTDSTAPNASNLEGHPASFFLGATAQAADSAQLGGVPAASYQLASQPAANSLKLGGVAASGYLLSTGTAVDSAKLGGLAASSFLLATGVATDSAKLGGAPASAYQLASLPAANAMKLNGKPDTAFLGATAQAADSAKLAGLDSSNYLRTNGVAADSSKLGGVAAASFARTDAASQTFVAPVNVTAGNNSLTLNASNFGGIIGSNGSGNLHLDATPAKGDGRIFLNWVSGKGTVFGNAQNGEAAHIDTAGNFVTTGDLEVGGTAIVDKDVHVSGDVHAGSFNGLSIFYKNPGQSLFSCDVICVSNPAPLGTCVAAKKGGAMVACSSAPISFVQTNCACASF